MNARHTIVTLVAGATLAIGTGVAQAHVLYGNTEASPAMIQSSQALRALDQRWEAIGKAYLAQKKAQTSHVLRPDDRSGPFGA
jgi:hypothetical protein